MLPNYNSLLKVPDCTRYTSQLHYIHFLIKFIVSLFCQQNIEVSSRSVRKTKCVNMNMY